MNDLNFLYDQTIEHMARLYGFLSTGHDDLEESGETGEDIEHVADLLVRRDLLLFAVTIRNFSESARLIEGMKKLPVLDAEIFLDGGPPCFREKKSSVTARLVAFFILLVSESIVGLSTSLFLSALWTTWRSVSFKSRSTRKNLALPMEEFSSHCS